jgi:hypothetical protein
MEAQGGVYDCLLATAARHQWGGEWRVTAELVQHCDDDGVLTVWRTSSDGRMVVELSDSGQLVPYLSVVMTRGNGICSADPWPEWEPAEDRELRAAVHRLAHPAASVPAAQPVPAPQPKRAPKRAPKPVPVVAEPVVRDEFDAIVAHLADVEADAAAIRSALEGRQP